MSYVVGNPEAAVAHLNISDTGSIPIWLQTFTLTINCTGKLTTQVCYNNTIFVKVYHQLSLNLCNIRMLD